MQDKYVGLALAITSTLAIGTSFVITKKGLNQAQNKHGFEGEGFTYLKNATWWAGMLTMALGEVANFAAYAFAPAILVTPLGALSVLIGAVLGSHFLDERLGLLGKIGCAICLTGSVIIVLHAPPDKDVQSINKMLEFALNPGFMLYCISVTAFAVVMIYKIAPKYGKKTPLVYISICSTVGSITIMAVKAFGIALKLTLAGHNQFVYPSTYVFAIIVTVCILTQMNYFNKALSVFSTSLVNPLYYVFFTTCTLIASFLLFGGFNTKDPVNTISLLCGFLIIFAGVYLLNLSRDDPDGVNAMNRGRGDFDAVPTDGIATYSTRRSMQARRSSADSYASHLPLTSPAARNSRRPSGNAGAPSPRLPNGTASGGRQSLGDREGLMHGYEESDGEAFGLSELAEESDEGSDRMRRKQQQQTTVFDQNISYDEEDQRDSGTAERGQTWDKEGRR